MQQWVRMYLFSSTQSHEGQGCMCAVSSASVFVRRLARSSIAVRCREMSAVSSAAVLSADRQDSWFMKGNIFVYQSKHVFQRYGLPIQAYFVSPIQGSCQAHSRFFGFIIFLPHGRNTSSPLSGIGQCTISPAKILQTRNISRRYVRSRCPSPITLVAATRAFSMSTFKPVVVIS